MSYRESEVYQALERIIENAGVSIKYAAVHDDPIDGEIWARSDIYAKKIIMPDKDVFSDEETACRILGHEMGHIMTGLESIDGDPAIREINERTCDLIGAYLYRLAEMTLEHDYEEMFKKARENEG